MKRLASLAVATSLALGSMAAMGRVAFATPFSDVPANHWAYQYVQSLAADGIIDGYPDGKFKGDRPLTRYEMAVVVARAVAHVQETGASKQDLEKLQKLIDALKDELDALGVRVTNLEDSLDALDKRTKFAQSVSLHGNLNAQYSQRDRTQQTLSIVNGTNASVTTYYGTAVASGKTAAIDPFVQAYPDDRRHEQSVHAGGSGHQPALRRQVLAELPDHRQPDDLVPHPHPELQLRRRLPAARVARRRAGRRHQPRARRRDPEPAHQVRHHRRHDRVAHRAHVQAADWRPEPLYFEALQPWQHRLRDRRVRCRG